MRKGDRNDGEDITRDNLLFFYKMNSSRKSCNYLAQGTVVTKRCPEIVDASRMHSYAISSLTILDYIRAPSIHRENEHV